MPTVPMPIRLAVALLLLAFCASAQEPAAAPKKLTVLVKPAKPFAKTAGRQGLEKGCHCPEAKGSSSQHQALYDPDGGLRTIACGGVVAE